MTTSSDKKAEILAELGVLWSHFPDWRLCQLISNLHGPGRQDIFYTEDLRLLNLIRDEQVARFQH